MFNRPKNTVFKPTRLHAPRKLVVNKVILEEHAISSATAPSSFVKEANKARDTISTALASIKNLPAHDDRKGVSSSHLQEYTQSIRTLDRIIRREWNYAITTYLSAPEHRNHRAVLLGKHPRRSYLLAVLLPCLLASRLRPVLSSSERTAAGVCAWPLKTRLICSAILDLNPLRSRSPSPLLPRKSNS